MHALHHVPSQHAHALPLKSTLERRRNSQTSLSSSFPPQNTAMLQQPSTGQTSIVHSHLIQTHPSHQGGHVGHNPLYIAKTAASQTSLSQTYGVPLRASQASLAQSQISYASSGATPHSISQQPSEVQSSTHTPTAHTPTTHSCADLPF